jgi:hypothetical protein
LLFHQRIALIITVLQIVHVPNLKVIIQNVIFLVVNSSMGG